jgi:hypothetical protein
LRDQLAGDKIEKFHHRFFFPFAKVDPMLPKTTLLFPACPDLLLEEIICEVQTLFLTIRSSQGTGGVLTVPKNQERFIAAIVAFWQTSP